MTKQSMKQLDSNNVPLRQFALYRPPYEELYTFWWKCMQITLHDKGTQTISSGDKAVSIGEDSPNNTHHSNDNKAMESEQLKQLMTMVNYYNSVGRESRTKITKTFRGASSLAPGFSPSMLTSPDNLPTTSPPKMSEMVQGACETPVMERRLQGASETPVMERRPLFKTSTPVSRSTSPPPRSSPHTNMSGNMTSLNNMPSLSSMTSLSNMIPAAQSMSPLSNIHVAPRNTSPVAGSMSLARSNASPVAFPASAPFNSVPSPSALQVKLRSPVSTTSEPPLPALVPRTTPASPFSLKQEHPSPTANSIFGESVTSSALSATLSAALLSQPLFSQAMSQLTSVMTSPGGVMTSSATSVTSPSVSSPGVKSEPGSSPLIQSGMQSSPLASPSLTENLPFTDSTDQFSDLIHIKQLTDVLGRKAVLDSLTPNISVQSDLSQYLGTSIDMAQAASLLGQLPTSTANSRNLLGRLCGLPGLYNVEQALKSEGYGSLGGEPIKTERSARHYQASEHDTSNITLPEGFESEDHLTWSEVECFVNEFKTKRVKLGYTQAHVGAALALVHGPEFSQTTISRFEGLQLSFPNHKKIIPILRRWLESVENPAKRRHHSPSGIHLAGGNPNSKRRKRTTISSNSKEVLEQYYQTNPLPSTDEIGSLSNNLALDKRVIRIWFQNRRAIGKRLSKLIVTMGGGASRPSTLTSFTQQQGLF